MKIELKVDGFYEKDGKILAVFLKPTAWIKDGLEFEWVKPEMTVDEKVETIELFLNKEISK